MTRTGERDLSRIGAIDYALMTIGSCLAAYSGGVSLSEAAIGNYCVIGIIIGSIFSYGMRQLLLRKPVIKLDGYLYALAVILAFVFNEQLQTFFPDGGYPQDVFAAGWLSCMLIFGSFLTWQDSTLLFQAVPAIAFFGLSGIYNTFDGVTFAFFGFLLCLATLFARAHRRAMLVQAAESGYFTRGLAPGTPTPSVETTPGLARQMQAGPWRWIAGPEWALLSALAIVLVSLLGAPVIRKEMDGVSGFVKLNVPPSVRKRQNTTASVNPYQGSEASIGQGPNHLTDDPVFEVKMDGLYYLRSNSFSTLRNHSWRNTNNPDPSAGDANTLSIGEIKKPKRVPFEARLRKPLHFLPVPGFLISAPTGIMITADGNAEVNTLSLGITFHGETAQAPTLSEPKDAIKNEGVAPAFMPDTEVPELSPRMRDLVDKTIAGAKTDYEKAIRIRTEIAKRVQYNINAAAIPPDADPVEYTLFDHPEAYCDVYATAMTEMARAAGIPARYVVGYLPDPQNVDQSGNYVVLDSDLHAWSELLFKDYGWVVFDATEGTREVPGQGRGSANEAGSFWTRGWVKIALDGGMVLLGLTALFFTGKVYMERKRNYVPRSALDKVYLSFDQSLQRATRIRRPVGSSPDEYLKMISPALGPVLADATALNAQFVSLLYSRRAATTEDVEALRLSLKALKKRLKELPKPDRKATAAR